MGAIELTLLAIGLIMLPWGADRKTQVTKLLYGKNAKLNRLTDSQVWFVKWYPLMRTVLSFPIFVSTASLVAGWGDYGSPLFIVSLVGLLASFVALMWAMGRAGALAIKTLKV